MTGVLLPPIRTLLGFLEEQTTESHELQVFALRNLNEVAHQAWFEIAEKLPALELSLENGEVKAECTALTALLLSQTHYHLEQYGHAMRYALRANEEFLRLFDAFYKSSAPNTTNPHIKQFVDIIVGKVLERFIENSVSETIDEQQEAIQSFVFRVIDLPPVSTTQWPPIPVAALKPLLGVTLDACTIDLTERVLRWSLGTNSFELMRYVVVNNTLLISTRHVRTQVFKLVADLYKEQFQSLCVFASPTPDTQATEISDALYQELPTYIEVLSTLEDVDSVATILRALIGVSVERNKDTPYLMALQLAFDITGFGNQPFLNDLKSHPSLMAAESPEAKLEMGEQTGKVEEPGEVKKVDEPSAPVAEKLRALNRVLMGNYEYSITLKFAHLRNGTDKELLEHVKVGLDSKHYVLHTSLIVAHGLMLRGTTHDGFLRKNLEWFGRSLCWGKFTATASLGVVHQTHTEKSFRVLSTYLPGCTGSSSGGGSSSSSTFSDGGSLYAMGLIHANRGDPNVISYLLGQLSIGSGVVGGQMEGQTAAGSSTVNEISQHGASLGLGLVAMGTHALPLYEALKSVLLMDSAVSGEAAALGIGLIMMGSGREEVIDELYQYAKDTRHEKIVRACGLAIAFVCYGREEYTTEIVQKLLDNSDPLIRYGGCFALGLSWCGSGREATLRHLLHMAVSDACNDVRRAAILAISYVVCNLPGQTPRVLKLLTDSFNFHVRFAAALAIGISCAGTASKEALEALVPATRDAADVVRQAAYIGLGLVLMECPDHKMEEMGTKAAAEGGAAALSAAAKKKAASEKKEHTTERSRKNAKNAAESELPPYPTPTQVREHFVGVATDRREDVMARVGALIGLGLLDAGGRNVTTSFYSARGVLRKEAVAGFCLFSQYWNWYPLMLTVSLAMRPTALIGLTGGLKAPESFALKCDAPPSHFAYPKPFTPKKREAPTHSIIALLSAAQRRTGAETVNAQLEEKKKEDEVPNSSSSADDNKSVEIVEPPHHDIMNMCRYLSDSAPLVSLPANSRYEPVFRDRIRQGGIIMLRDTRPNDPETYLEPAESGAEKPPAATTATVEQQAAAAAAGGAAAGSDEAPIPEPFNLD